MSSTKDQYPKTDCTICKRISCVCSYVDKHPDPECKFRVSVGCSTPVECIHGFDVCPECDPCTCKRSPMTSSFPNRASCPRCAGCGTLGENDEIDCDRCDGTGDICIGCGEPFFDCTCEDKLSEI